MSVTEFSDKTELFMEHPRLIAGQSARFLAHITVLSSGEPVRSGRLTLVAEGPDGTTRLEADEPARDGVFTSEGAFPESGEYQARLIIEGDQIEDTIELGTLTVHSDLASAREAAQHVTSSVPDDAISFLLEQQWDVQLQLAQANERTLVDRVEVTGRIEAPQSHSAVVTPPVAGRLLKQGSNGLPKPGERVEAGQVVGNIEPPLPATATAQLLANQASVQSLQTEMALKRIDLNIKAMEVQRNMAEAKARLRYAESEFQRIKGLREEGVSTEQQFEKARRDLELAQARHEAAQKLQQAYQNASTQLKKLQANAMSGMQASGDSQSPSINAIKNTDRALPIHAPISGRVVKVKGVAGEYFEPGQQLFRIVNLDRVWITAQVPEFELGAVREAPSALLTLDAYPQQQFNILENHNGELMQIGSVVNTESRTIPIRYAMDNPNRMFRDGMFASVAIETGQASQAVAIPKEAVVVDRGEEVAYVLVNGETFVRREVKLGVEDGKWVEVQEGIRPGERVVTQGANDVKLASRQPAEFGHGHAH